MSGRISIKYTPFGGQIDVLGKSEGSRVRLEVADTGPGIPPDLREKVFQRFFRIDDSRTTPGNGLGLSMVRAVAELHEAKLWLSDNSPGLKVQLLLPRKSETRRAE